METMDSLGDARASATPEERTTARRTKQNLIHELKSRALRLRKARGGTVGGGGSEGKDGPGPGGRNGGGGRPRAPSPPPPFDRDDDPHDLYDRFVATQATMFPAALREVREGWKRSCWMWFVLPTAPHVVDGVERGSSTNRRYALRGDGAVAAYLACACDCAVERWGRDRRDGASGEFEARTEVRRISLRDNYLQILDAIAGQLEAGNALDSVLGSMDAVKAVSSFRLFHRIARDVTEDPELEALCRRVLELASSTKRGRRQGTRRARADSY